MGIARDISFSQEEFDRAMGAIPLEEVERWMDIAKPGDELVYASGRSLPRTAAAVRAVRELYDAGEVELVQRRRGDGAGFNYVAQRRKRPVPPLVGLETDFAAAKRRSA